MLSFWVCLASHSQRTKVRSLRIFAISLEKRGGMNLVFLPADKYERFLQADTITLSVCSQAFPKYPK